MIDYAESIARITSSLGSARRFASTEGRNYASFRHLKQGIDCYPLFRMDQGICSSSGPWQIRHSMAKFHHDTAIFKEPSFNPLVDLLRERVGRLVAMEIKWSLPSSDSICRAQQSLTRGS